MAVEPLCWIKILVFYPLFKLPFVLTVKPNMLTDKTDMLTDKTDTLTDKTDMSTDKTDMLTDKTDMLTDKTDMLTDFVHRPLFLDWRDSHASWQYNSVKID